MTTNQRIHWEYEKHPHRNYKRISFRMSNKKMADILCALIQTHARIIETFHLGYEYTRQQRSYFNCEAIVEIAPQLEAEFETISGCRLETPQIIGVNGKTTVSEIY